MATPNLYLGLEVPSASNHTIQESVPFNVRFGNLQYFFSKFWKVFKISQSPSKFLAYNCLDWSCRFWETWVFISKHDVSNVTLPPSLLGHQTKYLQFMETFRITKIALFSPNTTLLQLYLNRKPSVRSQTKLIFEILARESPPVCK